MPNSSRERSFWWSNAPAQTTIAQWIAPSYLPAETPVTGFTARARTLTADYWYTVPESKRLTIATFSTPMGDIPNVMLAYFDAIVAASYWEDEHAVTQ